MAFPIYKSQTRKIPNHTLSINGRNIDKVSTYKYLGITLDMNLNYNKHLENVIKSISYKSLLLAKIRKYITQDVVIRIYKTMILPVLEYGDVLYDGANKKLIDKLKTIQYRCLHTCLLPQEHIPIIRLHEICGIGNLGMRRTMHLQLYMFKQKHNVDLVNNRTVYTRAHDKNVSDIHNTICKTMFMRALVPLYLLSYIRNLT